MIICSNTIDTEGNFALMNVDTPVSVKANLQTAQNEGETVKFPKNSELQSLPNGINHIASEEKHAPPIHRTNGELDASSDNLKKIVSEKNGSPNELFEIEAFSEPKLPELLNNDSSDSSIITSFDSSHALSSQTRATIDAQTLFDSSLVSIPETPNSMPCESANSQELSAICANKIAEESANSQELSAVCANKITEEEKLQNSIQSLSSFLQPLTEVAHSNGTDENMPDRTAKETTVDTGSMNADSDSNSISGSTSFGDRLNPSKLSDTTSELNFVVNNSGHSDQAKDVCDTVAMERHTSSEKSSEINLENMPGESAIGNLGSTEKLLEIQTSISTNSENSSELSEANNDMHSMNMKDYANLKVECSHYKSENEQLQHQLSILVSELNSFKSQQSQLLLTIEQQEKQLKQINENAKRQQELDEKSYAAFKQELESQNEKLKQEWAAMKHEKEVSVMRYAKSEMDVIKLREKAEACQKKLQEAIKERDSAQTNMKQLISDKTKYSQMYDNKCSEVRVAHNEIEQLKSDLNSRNNKLKWAQNKLKEEQDSHKETQSKLDEVTSTIDAARKEAEQTKLDAQASIKKFQVSQENRAFVLEQQLKEEQAKLILARAEKEDLDKRFLQLTNKLHQVEIEAKTLSEKNNRLTDQLQTMEKEKLEMEVKLSTMQQLMNKEVQENVELESQLSEMRNLRLELEEEKKKSESLEAEVIQLRSSNAELLIDMDSCRKKETETLEFTERLTAQNVKLQSDFSALLAKNEELEMEQSKINDLKAELEKEKNQRLEENKLLARHVAEHSQRCEELSKQLAEQKSENVVLRRKNAATIRELTRELQQVKKQFSEHSDGGGSGSNSLCQDSRASSCASLTDTSQALSSNPGSITVEPDKQTLIERIVELQRRNAQYLERVEFLEEHNQEMTEELKKKTKILQNFMLREPVGALSSNSMDSNKMALSKKGYMASLYSSKIKDKNMTLEKSLEICQTLHSLLEDTILKNITLKENMDTLGEEIARLRSERMKEAES